MAVTYVSSGTTVYSNGNPSPATPTHNVGDMLILTVGTKPDTTPATTPNGWTQLGTAQGGTGSTGTDAGPMRVGVFYRIADGTAQDTTGAITITGNNVSAAQVHVFRKTAADWDIAGVGAADTTTGATFSVTMPSNPGLTVGDRMLAVGVIPTDVTTPAQFTNEQVSATGMTTVTLTEIVEWDSTTGSDMGGWVAQGVVATGTSTGNPTVTSTAAATNTNVAGPIYLVRLREFSPTPKTGTDTSSIAISESSSVSVINTISVGSFIETFDNASQWDITGPGGVTDGVLKATQSGGVGTKAVTKDLINMANTTSFTVEIPNHISALNYKYGIRFGDASNYGGIEFDFFTGEYYLTQNGSSTGTFNPMESAAPYRFVKFTKAFSTNLTVSTSPDAQTWTNVGTVTATQPGNITLYSLDGGLGGATTATFDNINVEFFSVTAGDSSSIAISDSSSKTELSEYSALDGISGPTSWAVDNNDVNLGLEFYVTEDNVSATAAKFWIPTDGGWAGTLTGRLYRVDSASTGTVLATATFSVSGTGWQRVNFSSPVALTANQRYRIVANNVWSGTNKAYGATANYWTAAAFPSDKVVGPLVIPNGTNATGQDQGSYTYGATPAFPVNSFNSTNYWVDVVVTGAASAPPVEKTASDISSISIAEWTESAITTPGDTASLAISESTNIVPTDAITPKAGSDTASLAIAETSSLFITKNASDTASLAIAESRTTNVSLSRTDTGSLAVTETTATTKNITASDTSSIAIAEVASAGSTLPANDTSAIGIAEQASVGVSSGASDTSSIAISETSTIFKQISASDTASLSIAESTQSNLSLNRTDTSSISITESRATSVVVAASDTSGLAITESTGRNVSLSASDTASIAIIETTASFRASLVSDTASIAVSETSGVQGLNTLPGTDTGNIAITETASVQSTGATSDTSSIGITETAAVAKSSGASDTSALSISETQSIARTSGASDTSSISIVESSQVVVAVSASDTASLAVTESRAQAGSLSRIDTASVAINESTHVLKQISASDTFSIAISEVGSSGSSLPGTDTSAIGIAETSSLFVTSSAADTASLSIAESRSQNVSLSRSDTASLAINETRQQSGTISRGDTGSLSITESRSVAKFSSASDTAGLAITETSTVFVTLESSDDLELVVTEEARYRQPGQYSVNVRINEEWVRGTIKVFNNGEWREYDAKVYENGTWT